MVYCCAFGCNNRFTAELRATKGITFHKFPDAVKEPERLKRWVANLRRVGFTVTQSSRICSQHFLQEMFDRTGQIIRLQPHAVPTLFDFTSHLQKATNAAVKECGVCNEEFDEEARCPRIFQCFHSLCTYCIDQLIRKKTKLCPFCHKEFSADKADDVIINHTMLELMRIIALPKKISKRVSESEDVSRKKRLNTVMEEMKEVSIRYQVTCEEEQNKIKKLIEEVSNMQDDVKQENIRIENDVFPEIQNVISQNNKKIEELDNTERALHIHLKHLKDKDKEIDDVKMMPCTAALINEVEESNTAIGEWIEEFKRGISEDEKTIRIIEKEFRKTTEKFNIILEILSPPRETDDVIYPTPGTSANQDDESLPMTMTTETLREMSEPVKDLVKQGKVFAVQEHEGRRRSARISITGDNRLCLHHLREESLPSNVHIVKHGDVMRLVDPSTRMTFLELGSVGGSTLGRLYIRLNGDTKRAQQFFSLCNGEMGPSYAHTNILGVWNKGSVEDFVVGGDYERNDGGGGKALVEGLEKESGGVYKSPCLAGSVVGVWCWGEAKAAMFVIVTRDNPRREIDHSFGMVEEGLSVLTEAIAHYPNIRDVSIKDCGIVLPL